MRFRALLRAYSTSPGRAQQRGWGSGERRGGAQKVKEGALCSRPRPGMSPHGPVLIKSFIYYFLDITPVLSGCHPGARGYLSAAPVTTFGRSGFCVVSAVEVSLGDSGQR